MTKYILTNFNVPFRIRKRFDEVCHASGRTRTSVLLELMEDFILEQGNILAERSKRFEEVDRSIRENRRRMGFPEFVTDQSFETRNRVHTRSNSNLAPPSMFYSDGQEDW